MAAAGVAAGAAPPSPMDPHCACRRQAQAPTLDRFLAYIQGQVNLACGLFPVDVSSARERVTNDQRPGYWISWVPIHGRGTPDPHPDASEPAIKNVYRRLEIFCRNVGVGEPRSGCRYTEPRKVVPFRGRVRYRVSAAPNFAPPDPALPAPRLRDIPRPQLFRLEEWELEGDTWRAWCSTTCKDCAPTSVSALNVLRQTPTTF
ncbi:uncharacterized protein LOC127751327 [Frankliniella occidentalis]|uniref:Uncharacterized protein LOC127751327 n=1 Tax=Frankliniella occidentalis TaxID=133901 RepID=A0A9C6X7N1_FRAOC|nr:uncharacterized protein LOC127751327 [Frankliniella occidentalis]